MKRFEVWLARLDPAEGSEMRKTRPVVVVSPDEMNARLLTVMAAPLTKGGFHHQSARLPIPLRHQAFRQTGQFAAGAIGLPDHAAVFERTENDAAGGAA